MDEAGLVLHGLCCTFAAMQNIGMRLNAYLDLLSKVISTGRMHLRPYIIIFKITEVNIPYR